MSRAMPEGSLFDDITPPDEEKHACIECKNFAGQTRDKTGWLFGMRKGYCLTDGWHPAGTWAVIQDIKAKKNCKFFESAGEDTVSKRLHALKFYESKGKRYG